MIKVAAEIPTSAQHSGMGIESMAARALGGAIGARADVAGAAAVKVMSA